MSVSCAAFHIQIVTVPDSSDTSAGASVAGASVTAGASVATDVLSGALVAGGSTVAVGLVAGAQAESITANKRVIPMNLDIFLLNIFFLLIYYERIEASHSFEINRKITNFHSPPCPLKGSQFTRSICSFQLSWI